MPAAISPFTVMKVNTGNILMLAWLPVIQEKFMLEQVISVSYVVLLHKVIRYRFLVYKVRLLIWQIYLQLINNLLPGIHRVSLLKSFLLYHGFLSFLILLFSISVNWTFFILKLFFCCSFLRLDLVSMSV